MGPRMVGCKERGGGGGRCVWLPVPATARFKLTVARVDWSPSSVPHLLTITALFNYLAFSYVLSDYQPGRKHFYIGCICLSFLPCVISTLLPVTHVDWSPPLATLQLLECRPPPYFDWSPSSVLHIPSYYHHRPHGNGKGCDASVWGWCRGKCWLTVTSLSATPLAPFIPLEHRSPISACDKIRL